MIWNFSRWFCETRFGWQPSPAFFHTYTFFIVANHYLTLSEKNDFSPIIFNRPSPLSPTPREPLFLFTSFIINFFLVTLRSKPFSCKWNCKFLYATGFVLFWLNFTVILAKVSLLWTLTNLSNFLYSRGFTFAMTFYFNHVINNI